MWDTAGQERFRTITQSYYRSANGVIIAYDITKKETFCNVPRWIEDVQKYAGGSVICILLGKLLGNFQDFLLLYFIVVNTALTISTIFCFSLSLSVCLSVCLSVSLSVSLSFYFSLIYSVILFLSFLSSLYPHLPPLLSFLSFFKFVICSTYIYNDFVIIVIILYSDHLSLSCQSLFI